MTGGHYLTILIDTSPFLVNAWLGRTPEEPTFSRCFAEQYCFPAVPDSSGYDVLRGHHSYGDAFAVELVDKEWGFITTIFFLAELLTFAAIVAALTLALSYCIVF